MMKVDKKRMMITGVSGLLGNNLASYFRDKYQIIGLYHSHRVQIEGIHAQRIDLLSKREIKEVLNEFNPEVILHCAALANIEACEKNRRMARALNISATRNVIDCIKKDDIKFVYFSTDAVYDGKRGNYVETDETNPLSYYGLTKYKGELEALKKDNALIIRTNFFGWNIQDKLCLAEWIVHELSNKKNIRGFTDVYFSSIYTFDLAKLLDLALEKDLNGIYHFSSKTSVSKYEFAVRLAILFDLDHYLIKSSSIDNFPFRAKRGKNLRLDTTKLKDHLHCEIPSMPETIMAFYTDYEGGILEQIKGKAVLH